MATRGKTITVWSCNKNKKDTVNCIKLNFEDLWDTPEQDGSAKHLATRTCGKNHNRNTAGKINEIGNFCPLTHKNWKQ